MITKNNGMNAISIISILFFPEMEDNSVRSIVFELILWTLELEDLEEM